MFLILIVGALIIIAGKLYYENDKKNTRIEKYNELKAIADLKKNEIVQWKSERLSEANFFSKQETMVEETYGLVNGNKKSTEFLKKSLIHLVDGKRYENIFIIDNNGSLIFSIDSNYNTVDTTSIAFSQKAQNLKHVLFSDFYICNTHKIIHFDIIAPVYSKKGDYIATIFFRINPNDFLYPLIQSWPTPSKTAETLILRSDDDSVLFLNDLRHLKGTALKLKESKENLLLPGTQAVLGKVGLFEGKDYRNIDVLSNLDTIPGTGWSIVSKVDSDEIYAEHYRDSIFIILLVLFLILFVASLLILIYNSRQKNIYKELLANEIELHESQEEFRATLYSIGDGVITTDKKGLIKQMNGIAENLTGWNEKDAKGKKMEDVFQIINEETRNIVENPVKKVLKEGLIVGLANHTLLISKDGKEIPIADSGAPIKDVRGNITGVVVVFRDQTESRAQQRILKESEERFQLLFNKAPLGYQSLDFDGNFMDVNQQWLDTLGYTRNEVVGKWFGDFLVPEFRDAFKERFPIFKSQGFIHSEFEMLHKNGNRLFIAFDGRIGYNKFGEFIQTHCILQDITEQKKAELALRESEKSLSQQNEIITTLLKNLQIGVFMVEAPTGKPLMANEAAYQLLGPGILPDKNMKIPAEVYKAYKYGTNEPYPPEETPILLGLKGVSAHVDDMVVEQPDGTKTQLEIFGSPIYDKNGNIWASLVSFFDITERKRIEKDLKESEERFQRLMLNLEAGIVVHAPDTSIVMNNNRASEILGLSNEQMKGKVAVDPEWKFVNQYRMPLTLDEYPVNQIINSKNPIKDQILGINQPGKNNIVWVTVNGFPVLDKTGNITELVISFIDITEQKEAEEKLKENFALIKIAGEKVKLGGWNVILNENRSYWSDQVAAIHEVPAGYSPLVSDGINFYAPEWRDKITEVFTRCVQEGIPYDEEMEIITASGKRIWIRTAGEAVRDDNGKIFKVQGALQDISAQKHIEAQLNESELLFKALMDNSPIYIFFKDRDIKAMHLSKNYELMLGKPLSELIGKDMFDLFPSDLAKKMIEDDKKIVEEGKMVVVDEFFNDHYYTTIKFPILQENNEPLLAGFTIDITDRKKIEQELIKLNEELEQRIKERTQDLENKNSELERMNKAFIGRELRIKELKDKIKELENKN
ncbi:MAG: hypothetical protein A2X00_09990 [Bacteroidetes bacterium GWE2_32_14]|nr:MAG: hypothetical protein A2X00_09990 [Bacteroidetes bacterium GWE2_32_14]